MPPPLPGSAATEPHLLFVYGTLRRRTRHPMAKRLALKARYAGVGRLKGRLYHLGRYPGAVFSHHPDEWVLGELYEIGGVQGLLASMDRYEGLDTGRKRLSEYQRVSATIHREDGSQCQAWIYRYCRPVHRLRRLVSGDYLRQKRRPGNG